MNEDKIRMSAAEYRDMLGLDPVTPTKTKVVIEEKLGPPPADKLINSMYRVSLRLTWLAGWAWMLFTFGWVGHLLVRLTSRRLKKYDDTED